MPTELVIISSLVALALAALGTLTGRLLTTSSKQRYGAWLADAKFAEWEYACRAGTSGPYSCSNLDLNQHCWSVHNSGGRTQPVATRQPNPWGFFDMHGNVWEWCHDWFGPYSEGQRPLSMVCRRRRFEPSKARRSCSHLVLASEPARLG